jgi:TolA-binding protein
MIRKLLMTGLAVIVAAGVTVPAYARESQDDGNVIETVTQTVDDSVTTAEDATKSVEDSAGRVRDQIKVQRQQIEDRKKELRAQIEQNKQERTEKLEGRRLAKCQNRQANINSLIDKSVGIGRERLAKIQRFEEGIKKFYVDQSLSSASYEAAVADADLKEAAAIAAIDVIADQNFECTDVDAEKPSGVIKSNHEAKKAALNAYRDSVKELLRVVKVAFTATRPAAEVEN